MSTYKRKLLYVMIGCKACIQDYFSSQTCGPQTIHDPVYEGQISETSLSSGASIYEDNLWPLIPLSAIGVADSLGVASPGVIFQIQIHP